MFAQTALYLKIFGLIAIGLIVGTMVCFTFTYNGHENAQNATNNDLNDFDTTYPTVRTDSGLARGVQCQTYTGVKYYKFLGIPFAEPPVGKLRFKDPIPVKPWNGTVGLKEKDRCLQMKQHGTIQGSLDCLGINIVTPQINKTQLLPVMVLIHGGINVGSASMEKHKPDNFMNRNVIFCTIQYRLGVHGLLSFEDPAVGVPGNVAFKDNILALKWVKSNIVHFGGDPNQITLWGHSSGGVVAHLLSLSPSSRGLFNKLILQSCTALTRCLYVPRRYMLLGKQLKCKGTSQMEIFGCIESKNDTEILHATWEMIYGEKASCGVLVPFGVVVETYATDNSFLLESPWHVILNNHSESVPTIIGYVEHEATAVFEPLGDLPVNFTEEDYGRLLIDDINVGKNISKRMEIGREIVNLYYGDKRPSQENFYEYVNLVTDRIFFVKLYQTMRLIKYFSSAPTYFYKFKFFDPEWQWNKDNPSKPLIGHAYELAFMFHWRDTNNWTSQAKSDFIKGETLICDLLCNFAKSGVPSSSVIDFPWKPVGEKNFNLVMQPNVYLAEEIEEKDRMDFWDELYLTYNHDEDDFYAR